MQNYEHNSLKLESSILPRSKSKTLLASMVLTGAILLSPAISDTYTASADSIDNTEISTQATDITQTDITNSDDATAQSHYNQTNAESVNEYRAENGKSQLTQQSDLDEFAKWKIDSFAGEFPTLGDINEFNQAGGNVHEFNGKSVDQQYEDYHGKPAEGWLGENLAYSTGYVPEGTVGALDEQTMKQWKNSAPHDANMLNDNYGSIGTAYWSNGDGTYYTVQVFESGERVVEEVEPPAPGGDTGVDNEDSQIEDIDDNTDNIGVLDPDEEVTIPGEDDEGSYEIPANPVEPEPTPEPEVPAEPQPEVPANPEPNDPKHPEAPDWVDGNQDVYDDEDDVETPAEPEPTPEPDVEPEAEEPAEDNTPGGDTGVDNEDTQIEDIDDNTDNIGVLDPDEEVTVPGEDDEGSYEIPEDPVDPEPTPGEDAEDGNTPEDESTDDESDETPAPETDADDETDAEPENSDSEDVVEPEDNDAVDSEEPESNDSDNATDSEEAVEPEDGNAVDSEDNTENDATDNESDNASDAGEVVVDPETNEPVLITPEAPVMPEAVVDAENPRETETVEESDESDDNVAAPSESTNTPSTDTPADSTDADASNDASTEATVTNGTSSIVAKSNTPAEQSAVVNETSNNTEAPVASTIDPSDVEAVETTDDAEAAEEEAVAAETLPDTGIADTGKTTLFGAIAALLGAGAFAITRRKRSEEK